MKALSMRDFFNSYDQPYVSEDWGWNMEDESDGWSGEDYVEDYIPVRVIYNNRATVVEWGDGSKTVVHCSKEEIFVPEVGLAMAVVKKLYGNRSEFLRWVKDAYYQPETKKKAKKLVEPTPDEIVDQPSDPSVVGADHTNFDVE